MARSRSPCPRPADKHTDWQMHSTPWQNTEQNIANALNARSTASKWNAYALTDVARYIMMASLLMRAFKIFILDWLHYAGV